MKAVLTPLGFINIFPDNSLSGLTQTSTVILSQWLLLQHYPVGQATLQHITAMLPWMNLLTPPAAPVKKYIYIYIYKRAPLLSHALYFRIMVSVVWAVLSDPIGFPRFAVWCFTYVSECLYPHFELSAGGTAGGEPAVWGSRICPISRFMMIAAAFLVLLRPYSIQCVLLLLLLLLGTIATILFFCCWHRRLRNGKHPIKSVLSGGRSKSRGE